MDALANGRRIKYLTIVDDFSRECIDIAVDHGIGGEYVTRVLERVGQFRGYLEGLRTDQAPEFTSRALLARRMASACISACRPHVCPFVRFVFWIFTPLVSRVHERPAKNPDRPAGTIAIAMSQ